MEEKKDGALKNVKESAIKESKGQNKLQEASRIKSGPLKKRPIILQDSESESSPSP